MPLTPAHAAAAWPLSRLLPSLPLDALVIGTLAPDFEYLIQLEPRGRVAHSPMGLFVFCLPLGMAVWAVYRHVVRPALVTLFPEGLRADLVARRSSLVSVAAAILVGAVSHLLWDSFTHYQGWSVRHFPVLWTMVHIAGSAYLPLFRILQHVSTLVGLVALVIWARRWLGRQPPAARAYTDEARSRAIRVVAMLLCAVEMGALLNSWRGFGRPDWLVAGYAVIGAMVGLALALLVFGLVAQPSPE